MKKRITNLCITLAASLLMPLAASAQTPPSVVTGYVGNVLELEDAYNISIEDSEDEEVYSIYEECNKVGSTRVEYYDYDSDSDNYGTMRVDVKYNPSLRLIGIEWRSTRKTVKIQLMNISDSDVTFYSSGAKYVAPIKSQSKKMKLSKGSKVTVKPGQIKTISFKTKSGSIKYPSLMDLPGNYFEMKCKFKGVKSTIRLDLEEDECNFYQKIGGSYRFIDTECDEWDWWM